MNELMTHILGINDPYLSGVLNHVFSSPFRERFENAPGASGIHHAYPGGLLEHTNAVVDICQALCHIYGLTDNRDLLIAGAILHDIGKVCEYEQDGKRTTAGRVLGHVSIGAEMVGRFDLGYSTYEQSIALRHMILSHHGRKEWGSPVEPMTLEATLLHHADLIDAQQAIVAGALVGEGEFTEKHPVLGRRLWRGKA